jgi:hypothetical protein
VILKGSIAPLLTASVVILMTVTGCGGSSSSGDSTPSQPASSKGSKSEPSAEFTGQGPNSGVAKFGKEAAPAEREAASNILEESLQARADGEWEAQCSTLAAPIIKGVEKTGSALGAGDGCPAALEAQAKPAPESVRANPMTGPIDVLRVGGNRGFALFHGTKGKDYVIPLLREGGEWKVASLVTEEAP